MRETFNDRESIGPFEVRFVVHRTDATIQVFFCLRGQAKLLLESTRRICAGDENIAVETTRRGELRESIMIHLTHVCMNSPQTSVDEAICRLLSDLVGQRTLESA